MGNCIRLYVADQSKRRSEIPTSSPGGDGDRQLSSETSKCLFETDQSGMRPEEAKSLWENNAGGVLWEESRDNYDEEAGGATPDKSKDIYEADPSGEAMSEELKRLHENVADGEMFDDPNLTLFTLADLMTATKNFDPDSLLGEGGSGTVYRGWIQENSIEGDKEWIDENSVAAFSYGPRILVAIKKLSASCLRGSEEWMSEVNFLGRLSHSNLVKLLGYCREGNEQLLVYEYMPKGSLENHLFKRKHAAEALTWERRINIALDAARGLAFLHSLDQHIICRDLKTSKILLDVNYTAKVSDFCLSAGAGVSGENGSSDKTSSASNVYRFGAVMLELLAGKRLVDMARPIEQQGLIEWARTRLSNKEEVKTIMDPRLNGQYLFKAALEAAHLILKCLELDPKSRPSMQEIVESLQQIAAMKKKAANGKRVRSTSPAVGANHKNIKQPSPRQSPLRPRYTGGQSGGRKPVDARRKKGESWENGEMNDTRQ